MNKLIQPEDKKFVIVDNVDPYFSPKRNQSIIDSVIAKYEAKRAKQQKDFIDNLRERTDAVASYLKSRAADSNKPIEQYISRNELARLQGKKIIQKLQNGYTTLDWAN